MARGPGGSPAPYVGLSAIIPNMLQSCIDIFKYRYYQLWSGKRCNIEAYYLRGKCCVWKDFYTRSSAIVDKPRDAVLYSCWGIAGRFVRKRRREVHNTEVPKYYSAFDTIILPVADLGMSFGGGQMTKADKSPPQAKIFFWSLDCCRWVLANSVTVKVVLNSVCFVPVRT